MGRQRERVRSDAVFEPAITQLSRQRELQHLLVEVPHRIEVAGEHDGVVDLTDFTESGHGRRAGCVDGHGAPQGAQAPAKSSGETARALDGLVRWSAITAPRPAISTNAYTMRMLPSIAREAEQRTQPDADHAPTQRRRE